MFLHLNLDHVATLRQLRGEDYPSLLEAARLSKQAGVHGITLHLREDRRHVQDHDIYTISQNIQGRFTLEMAADHNILDIAKEVKPSLLTLVPERREELTTESGLDLLGQADRLREFVQEASVNKLECSLFVDPEEKMIEQAKSLGASRVELHTGAYAKNPSQFEINRLINAASLADKMDLRVNAGHGLHKDNLGAILQIPHIEELHIGHAIVCRAVFVGLKDAINEITSQMK